MRLLLAAIAVIVAACPDGQAATDMRLATATTVDSIVDPQVAIARFVASVPQPDELTGGARTPDKLVAMLFDALAREDTTAIGTMSISRAEYGYFYYPTSVHSKKPYELPPDVAWMLSSESSAKGARRLLARLGGRKLTVNRHRCSRIEREGANEVHSNCDVSYSGAGDGTETRSLFRSIVIRDGVAKFLSYSGDF